MKKFFKFLLAATLVHGNVAFAQTSRVVTGDTFPGALTEKNYLQKNPDAEIKSVLGWTRYVDTGSRPVDGTGGSPTSDLTWTVSSTDPLSGTHSFLITKTAANTQGAGVAIDFTIDRKDRGNYLQLNFDVELVSGTYNSGTEGASPTDSDQIVYLYDVTNAALIEPDVYKVKVGTSGTPIQHQPIGFFAKTNSSSYRLIIHTATTSASAYTLKLDNFKLGRPSKVSYTSGLPVLAGRVKYNGATNCDWYTSSATFADFSADTDCNTATVVSSFHNMVAAAPTKIPGFRLNYKPGKYVVIASLTSYRDVNGTYNNYLRFSDGTQTSSPQLLFYGTSFPSYEPYTIQGYFEYTGTGDVDVRIQGRHNPNPNSGSVRILADATGLRDLEFTILYYPESGETTSSVGQLSQEVRASYTTNSGQSIDDSIDEIVNYEDRVEDTHNAVAVGSSWRFTAPIAGAYKVCAGNKFSAFAWAVGDITRTQVFKNGSLHRVIDDGQQETTNSVTVFRRGCVDVDLLALEYIDIRAYQDSGGGRTLTSVGSENYIDISRINPGNIQPTIPLSSTYLSVTSGEKTPGSSGVFYQMTGNSISIPAGEEWELSGSCIFSRAASPVYTVTNCYWTDANGTDTNTGTPAAPSGLLAGSHIMTDTHDPGIADIESPMQTVRVSSGTYYLVPFATMSTPGNARITVKIYGKRVK